MDVFFKSTLTVIDHNCHFPFISMDNGTVVNDAIIFSKQVILKNFEGN